MEFQGQNTGEITNGVHYPSQLPAPPSSLKDTKICTIFLVGLNQAIIVIWPKYTSTTVGSDHTLCNIIVTRPRSDDFLIDNGVFMFIHSERGLRLKRICTETSDALCATMDGYFCRDPRKRGCRAAQRHSVSCSPGHHIGQKGWCLLLYKP